MEQRLGRKVARLTGAFAACFLLVVPQLGAQEASAVTGRVTNARTGDPLPAVQVFIPGPDIGVLTQQNGRYLLQNVPAGTHTVTAQRIGFRTATAEVTVQAGGTLVQDFQLSEEALQLDEVVVTGTPGGTQRRAIGNTVATLDAGEITQDVAITSVEDVFRARTPGVQLSRASGNIGSGSDLQVRGIGTFNLGRNPLIYVDGIRLDNSDRAGPVSGSERQVNVLNDLNPMDIESVEIIKGPAAATLYGTEASAGVIQIITKRGREGAPQFNVSVRQGVNFQRDPAGRIGTKWTCNNSFAPPCEEGSGLVPYNAYDEANFALHNGTFNPFWKRGPVSEGLWPQENLFQYGHSQSYNIGVRGGTETIRYFLQTSYDDDEGPVWYNWNKAFRTRANLGVVFNENFSLDVSTGYVQGDTRFSSPAQSEGGIWSNMGWGTGYCAPRISVDENPCPRTVGFQEHLPTDLQQIESTREYQRFTGSGTLNFTFGDWLSSRLVTGIDRRADENGILYPIDTRQEPVFFRNYRQTFTGSVWIERPINTEFTFDWSATADLDVNDSFSSATSIGAQYYLSRFNELRNQGQDFASPLSTTVNQTPVTSALIEYAFIENRSVGVYVQEQVGWNDRLFVTGAVRFDDNSAFGSQFDLETYPKVSATWVASEESFWNIDLVNSLRLRGAWGQAGRQPDTFAGVNTFGIIAGVGGATALEPASGGNPDVGPEKGTEFEVGFDVAVLDDRVSGEFTWYQQKNEGALLDIPLPPSLGAASEIQQNVGRIDNWGWESSLNARIYQSPSVSFDLYLSGAYSNNEIKELGPFPAGDDDIRIGWQYPVQTEANHWVMEAEYDDSGPIQDAWGRNIQAYCDQGVHLSPDGGDPRETKYGVVRGGTVVPCQDVGGYAISAGPAFWPYSWSVQPTISLFNNALRLHALFDGAYGKIGLDGQQEWGHRYNNSYDSRCECSPQWVAGDRLGSVATWGYYDADFWKLREIGLRYSVPDFLAQRIGAERASLAFSAREVAILWRAAPTIGLEPGEETGNPQLTVLDPELGRIEAGNTNQHRVYPPNTNLHLTLNVTF